MSVEALAAVLHHSRAVGTDKVVLLGIANHEGDGGAWPSLATLARYANVNQRTVQRSLKQLEVLGELWIGPKEGGTPHADPRYRTNLYRVRVRCPVDCDGTTQHRVGVRGDPDTTPTSPLADPAVTNRAPRGDKSCDPEVTPASSKPSLEPSLEPAPAKTDSQASVNQVAKKLVDDYWAHVKEQTGKHPVGVTWKAMRGLVVPFLEAGYTVAELKGAMKAVRDNGRSFTRQVLEQHLDGRARRRVAGSRAQAQANVDAQVRDEFEDAVAAGDYKLAWRIFRDKAGAASDPAAGAIAERLEQGVAPDVIEAIVTHRGGEPVTAAEVAAVVNARAEIDARCAAARGEPRRSRPMVEPGDRPTDPERPA